MPFISCQEHRKVVKSLYYKDIWNYAAKGLYFYDNQVVASFLIIIFLYDI